MTDFVYRSSAVRVVFGSGTIDRVAEELELLGCGRALVLATPGQVDHADAVRDRLGGRAAGVFTGARMHTPVETTEEALTLARALEADCTVAVGGGSTIGLGKALTHRTGLPQVAVPTTYAGSEVTPVLGETRDGRKTTLRDPAVAPRTVVYDVDLTMSLPAGLTGTSGLNAMAHAVEALWARDRNPVTSLLALEAVGAFATALPRLADDPLDRDARSAALYGAWLSGTCLGTVGMALHHKLCHVLGGTFDLPHSEVHAVVLPHVVDFNAPAVPAIVESIARVLKAPRAGDGIRELRDRVGAPRSLRELGMPRSGIARAAELVTADGYPNVRPIDRAEAEDLLIAAWSNCGDAG
ncbi:MAG: maleylacetate reductase [Pseudonocardia sp.]|uniref:maleylacetate reductase n=1 Tax=unclassified Pseudonocardia TaxID=2619320 RepID=UPI000869D06D|nr:MULTISPECIES: maleylacetate reductase [unclassified Pseudonocardia]MBN9107148.1 maleylacetate reductase [Pseudonocardia sp.]ODU26367.1 MAG: maleylacetate reductase [Pseudonocardia sp. SCN 72-51]ODV02702.1 MAG: maleylacetate reductase [Pseudonocardia sp. SCN 73-27]